MLYEEKVSLQVKTIGVSNGIKKFQEDCEVYLENEEG